MPLQLRPWIDELTIKTTSLQYRKLDLDFVDPDPTIGDWGWAQRPYIAEIERQYNAGRPVRIIVLKARQLGLSTATESVGFVWCFIHPGTNALVLAHEDKASQRLYQMTRLFWERWEFAHLFEVAYKTRRQLRFHEPVDSQIEVATAKNPESLRSGTFNMVHGCVHENQLVVLADGSSKAIRDIELGDRVFTSSGAIAPVTAKTQTGVKPTLKLTAWLSNEPIRASADHRVLTIDGYKRLGEITSKDWVARPAYRFESAEKFEFSLPLELRPQGGGTARKDHETFTLDRDFGYLVGYYLAEGHIPKNKRRLLFTFHTGETYYQRVAKFFARPPILEVRDNRTNAVFNDKFMAHALERLCGRVEDKHVPLFGNLDFFAGILDGYLDGDGSKTDRTRVSAPSIHERIARNINRIGEMLGRKAAVQYYERERYGVPSKPVWVNTFCHGASRSRAYVRKYRFVNGQCFVRVKSVVPDEEAETYELQIDHPDHNYETPSGVIANSEVAFWPDPETLYTALHDAVPRRHKTMVVLESTANGVGNWWHEQWLAAENGESEFIPMFFPWFFHDAYRLPGTGLRRSDLDDEEVELLKLMQEPISFTRGTVLNDDGQPYDLHPGLNVEQCMDALAWRRVEVRAKGLDKFHQEMPATPEEAFISTGNPIFPPMSVRDCYEPMTGVRGTLYRDSMGRPFFDHQHDGDLRVYRQPSTNPRDMGPDAYFVSADPSENRHQGDPAAIQVIRRRDNHQVAVWHSHASPVVVAKQMMLLGHWYHGAMLCPEVEGGGQATIGAIMQAGYPNVWSWKKPDRTTTSFNTWGWSTNYNTKLWAITELRDLIVTGAITIHDKLTYTELLNFVEHPNGNMGNSGGSPHDDTVMALAIAVCASKREGHFTPQRHTMPVLDIFSNEFESDEMADILPLRQPRY